MANFTVNFEIYNEETVRILKEEDPDLLPDYSVNSSKDLAYNKKQVTNAITSGIIKGESIPKIASNLQSTIKNLNQSSAVSAARTAAIAAQNTGSLSAMKRLAEMGVEVQKEWVATLDSRTRLSHRALDGQRRNLDEEFSNGLQYPGASGNPAERWNCRCKIKAYMPKYDSEDEPRLTYSEWEEFKKETGASAKKISEAEYNELKAWGKSNKSTEITGNLNTEDFGVVNYKYDQRTKGLIISGSDYTGVEFEYNYDAETQTLSYTNSNGKNTSRIMDSEKFEKFLRSYLGINPDDIYSAKSIISKNNYGFLGAEKVIKNEIQAEKVTKNEISFDDKDVLSPSDTWVKIKELFETGEYKGKTGNECRAVTNKLLGYDTLPTILSAKEFTAQYSTGVVLYRGYQDSGEVTASSMIEQLKYGDLWTGISGGAMYGTGIYFGTTNQEAENYGTDGLVTAALSNTAKIASFNKINENYKISGKEDDNWDYMKKMQLDVGKYAAVEGYDAIYVEEQDYYVVLNRGKLIIKGDN